MFVAMRLPRYGSGTLSVGPLLAGWLPTPSQAGVTGRDSDGGLLPLPDDDNALLGRDRPPKPSARPPALAEERAHGAGCRVGTAHWGDDLPLEEELLGLWLMASGETVASTSGSVISMLLCCS